MATTPEGSQQPTAAASKTAPSGELTRQGVPVSTRDGIHPGLATTAVGLEEDIPTAIPADPWVGRVLSNVYRVDEKIGEGGMGAVYLAKHIHLQKAYAIKVLSSQVANNAQAVERLKQEAIAASSIEHDNIVDVVNFDRSEDGSVYIVMELLRGESLAARLERGRMAPAEALPIAWQICAALGAAHARGIVHRDLKPENVFLAKRGEGERVKVLDFGISKVKSAEADGVRMTRTGQLVGTPLYMSPEQAKGEQDIDLRVDVYALGVMLYEMLVGVPPFEGRNYFELLWKHGNENADPMRVRKPDAEIPEALDRAVLRALEKARDARYPSMEAFSKALEDAVPEVVRVSNGSMTSIPPEVRRASLEPRRTPTADLPRDTLDAPRSPSITPEPNRATQSTGARRGALAAAVAVIALLVIGGAAWGLGDGEAARIEEAAPAVGRGEGPPREASVEEAVIAPEPPSVPLGVEPPEPAGLELVTVGFEGTPAGTEVRGPLGEVLCTVPCLHDLPARSPVVLSLHHDGYLDESRTIVPAEVPVLAFRLRPRRRATSEGTGSELHLKTEL